jgi:hypothetical protein
MERTIALFEGPDFVLSLSSQARRFYWTEKLMKLSLFMITGIVLLLSSCTQFETDHYTDLAIDT